MKVLKLLKKSALFVLPILIAISIGWYLRTESDFFLVKNLKVDLEFQENQEALLVSIKPEVQKALLGLKGKNIWSLSLNQLRDEVMTLPWIQDVELSRRFPDQIHSLVRLHPVAFLFLDKKNQIFPILENGKRLSMIPANLAPVAPLLRNNNIVTNKEELQNVIRLFADIPLIGPFKRENIESVDFNSITGLTLKLIEGNVLVHLGKTNVQTKALQVLRVTDYLESQKQKARVIDASFTKKVLVRLRKRS